MSHDIYIALLAKDPSIAPAVLPGIRSPYTHVEVSITWALTLHAAGQMAKSREVLQSLVDDHAGRSDVDYPLPYYRTQAMAQIANGQDSLGFADDAAAARLQGLAFADMDMKPSFASRLSSPSPAVFLNPGTCVPLDLHPPPRRRPGSNPAAWHESIARRRQDHRFAQAVRGLVRGGLQDHTASRLGPLRRLIGVGFVQPDLDPRTAHTGFGQKGWQRMAGIGGVGMKLQGQTGVKQNCKIAAGTVQGHAKSRHQKRGLCRDVAA